MKRLMPALLSATLILAPALPAFAQAEGNQDSAAQSTDGGTAGGNASGASGDVSTGQMPEASGGEGEPGSGTPAEEIHAATPHYPLEKPAEMNWSFAGPFGHWDIAQLQRGLKVYKEVCSACHSMNLVAIRSLSDLGYNDAQVKAFAAQYTVQDGPNDQGEMFDRPGIPSDHFPAPFANPQAAAAANGGGHPPDFSLLAKARAVERGFPTFIFDIFTQYAEGGPDYIHALLTGYGEEPPADLTVQPGTYYNPHFIAGPALKMPPPLSDGLVEYTDGAPQTVDQYARDVAAFMMWAAEPHLVTRKATGMVVMVFLIVFAVLLFLVKRRVWAGTPH